MPVRETTTASDTLVEGVDTTTVQMLDGTEKRKFDLKDATPADAQLDALIQAGTKSLNNLTPRTIEWVAHNAVVVIDRAKRRHGEYAAALADVQKQCEDYRRDNPHMFVKGVAVELPKCFANKRALSILVGVFDTTSDANGKPRDTAVLRFVHECCVHHSTNILGVVVLDVTKVGIPYFTKMYAATDSWLAELKSSL